MSEEPFATTPPCDTLRIPNDFREKFHYVKELTMLTIRDHGVPDYVGLRDMDATDVGVLGDDDRACLDEIGRYLADADAWERFGIWLLHKHFDPAPGEVFVERAITSPRKTETAPLPRSAFGKALSPTAIRFDAADSTGVAVVGMEFAAPGDFGDTLPLSEHDEQVLAGIAERLATHDKMERFGVRLIRNPLGLSEHELLQETCDSAQRTLHCHVGERDALLDDHTTVQTAWRWKVALGHSEPSVMQECTASCVRADEGHDISHQHGEPDVGNSAPLPIVMQECLATCKSVGEGHDIAHSHSEPDEFPGDFGND